MSGDLRAAVLALIAAEHADGRLLMWMGRSGAGDIAADDILALIPKDAVLVTEETLAAALVARYVGEVPDDEWDAEFNWHRDEVDLEKCRAAVRGYMRRLREGT